MEIDVSILEFSVRDDAAFFQIGVEDPTRFEAALALDIGRVDLEGADLGTHHEQAVMSHDIT